jgi:hypothetical protein
MDDASVLQFDLAFLTGGSPGAQEAEKNQDAGKSHFHFSPPFQKT